MANLLFRAASNAIDTAGTSTTDTIAAPVGTVENDLGVIYYASAVSAPDAAPTHTAPAGWSTAGTITFTANAGALNARFTCYFRIEGAAPQTETVTSSVAASHITHRGTWDNPNTDNPFDTIDAAEYSGTTATAPTITTAENNEMLIFFAAAVEAGITWTPPTNFTERQDAAQSELADRLFIDAGATGATSATASATASGVAAMAAFKSEVTPLGWEVPAAMAPVLPVAVAPSGMTPSNG